MTHPDIKTNDRPIKAILRLRMRAGEMFGITLQELQSKSRIKEHCEARFAVIVALYHIGYSWCEIGRQLGNRNHSTIIHGYSRGIGLCKSQPGFSNIIAELVDSVVPDGSEKLSGPWREAA